MKLNQVRELLTPSVQMLSCSVKLKGGRRRRPVIVFGKYENVRAFNQALRKALNDEDEKAYDLRTVRTHDEVYLDLRKLDTRIISLENLHEDINLRPEPKRGNTKSLFSSVSEL